jgi:methionyl-tRNA synthetase
VEVSEKQVYSNADGRFLPDRYIEGTCPNCGYDRARGDQCENCTKQLDPTDLIDPRSAISGSTDLEVRETKHLYLRQSAMRDVCATGSTARPTGRADHLHREEMARRWRRAAGPGHHPRSRLGRAREEGDQDWPGMEGKVFYVWFDAPIEYIACAAEWVDAGKGDNWERWWRTDKGAEDVRYVQFMGKDNVPFHTLSFPATILGSGEPWKLVDYIKSFNYLNYDGGQFSTSQGRGVFMDQALDILPSDYWRWWLLSAMRPETSDSEFTWEAFQQDVNKDLADVLGNFVSRITKFCRSKFGEAVPEGGAYGEQETALIADLEARLARYQAHMDAIEMRKAAAELRAIWVAGNEYLQSAAPWTAFKEDPDRAAAITRFALNLIPFYAGLSAPFIPDAAAAMADAMNAELTWPDSAEAALSALPPGHAFTVPDVLFAKIADEDREGWAERIRRRPDLR